MNVKYKQVAFAAMLLMAQAAMAIEPASLYPGAAPGSTNFLNKDALLGNANDPAWFHNNIPFLDVPDRDIQQVYYYRWQTYKEHLVYTGSIYGWLSSEFLQPASYGAPYGGISPRPVTRRLKAAGCAISSTSKTTSTTG